MFKAKNVSPGKLSFFTAVCLAVPVALGFYLVSYRWSDLLISFVLVFLASLFHDPFCLNEFIYRKIKVIYKYIYQTKASKKEEMYYKYILPTKSIEEVNEDVEKWAEQRKEEIEYLSTTSIIGKNFCKIYRTR
jgi:two-component system phosphate regulon sensor histidine kinase PhoR